MLFLKGCLSSPSACIDSIFQDCRAISSQISNFVIEHGKRMDRAEANFELMKKHNERK